MPEKRQVFSAGLRQSGKAGAVFLPVLAAFGTSALSRDGIDAVLLWYGC
jgi:hypothetical protein